MRKMSLIVGATLCGCPGLLLALSTEGRPTGAGEVWPARAWERGKPEQVGMDKILLEKARDYALTGSGSGCITRYGKLVMQWGDQKK